MNSSAVPFTRVSSVASSASKNSRTRRPTKCQSLPISISHQSVAPSSRSYHLRRSALFSRSRQDPGLARGCRNRAETVRGRRTTPTDRPARPAVLLAPMQLGNPAHCHTGPAIGEKRPQLSRFARSHSSAGRIIAIHEGDRRLCHDRPTGMATERDSAAPRVLAVGGRADGQNAAVGASSGFTNPGLSPETDGGPETSALGRRAP
jgi:hypothetical protein